MAAPDGAARRMLGPRVALVKPGRVGQCRVRAVETVRRAAKASRGGSPRQAPPPDARNLREIAHPVACGAGIPFYLSGDMSDQTYDDGRARELERLLRSLAERIRELDAQGSLLANPAELTKLIGDVKSELFHYEVRATYDTPEVADSRRIVNDAIKRAEQGDSWQEREWTEESGDDAPEW